MNINEIISTALEDIYLDYPSLAETINEKKEDYFITIMKTDTGFYTMVDFQTPQVYEVQSFVYQSQYLYNNWLKYENAFKHLKEVIN